MRLYQIFIYYYVSTFLNFNQDCQTGTNLQKPSSKTEFLSIQFGSNSISFDGVRAFGNGEETLGFILTFLAAGIPCSHQGFGVISTHVREREVSLEYCHSMY